MIFEKDLWVEEATKFLDSFEENVHFAFFKKMVLGLLHEKRFFDVKGFYDMIQARKMMQYFFDDMEMDVKAVSVENPLFTKHACYSLTCYMFGEDAAKDIDTRNVFKNFHNDIQTRMENLRFEFISKFMGRNVCEPSKAEIARNEKIDKKEKEAMIKMVNAGKSYPKEPTLCTSTPPHLRNFFTKRDKGGKRQKRKKTSNEEEDEDED
jgi:hypothetical protein